MDFDFLKIKHEDTVNVTAEALFAQAVSILMATGVPEEHARITAEILVAADLRGVDTHGVINVLEYVKMIQAGRYTIPQKVEILLESPSTALLTNGNGLGFIGAYRAMELAIEKAKTSGVAQVVLRDGHHTGMLAYYPMMALPHNMIGMAMTNASRSVRPLFGARPRIGTNPLAFAAPAGEERPFVLDMATSVVASSKLDLARFVGVEIPIGWATSADGQAITVPPEARSEEWAINPLGNMQLQGGHKGYGLGVVVDILAGILSGGGFGAQLSAGENMTWVMAVNISTFRPVSEFKEMMDEMIRELHATPPETGRERVLVAGDPEADAYEERHRNGVPVHRLRLEALRALAQELGASIHI